VSINRRKHARYHLHTRVTFTMNDIILWGSRSINISSGGMCIAINDNIDICDNGMLILVHKHNDAAIYFQADFSVAWNSGASSGKAEILMGIAFKELNAKNQKALDRILSFQSNVDN
jgi:c-di-GMP-binding flagellar brake protein YcgR